MNTLLALAFGVVLAGVSLPGESAQVRLSQTGATWYLDYTANLSDEPPGFAKAAMVRCGPSNTTDLSTVAQIAASHPGHTWIICNEPDVADQDGGRMDYTQIIRDYVNTIKLADPTATTVGPNVLSTSIGWTNSTSMFDITGVHVYVPYDQLPHALDAWTGNRRVWVTEFGQATSDPVEYVRAAVQVFRQAGVERWFIFSSDPIPPAWSGYGMSTFLRDGRGNLTILGQMYRSLMH